MWLVVGLGNPGAEYAETRHNIGFEVESLLRERASAEPPREKFGGALAAGTLAGERIHFLRPMEFMNLSGQAVGKTASFFKVAPEHVVVVHDDIDLPFGRLRVAAGGGHGGHNGIRSIIQHLGTNAFARVRIGVGRPQAAIAAAGHVLGRFSVDERAALPEVIGRAADAVTVLVERGTTAAMNSYNGTPQNLT